MEEDKAKDQDQDKHEGEDEGGEKKTKDQDEPGKEYRMGWLKKKFYNKELERLQFELVKMQYWIKAKGERLVIIFEGRDAAGKGGTINRIVTPLNPRGVRLVALPKPSDVERTQWYFQRYVANLPAAGEMVIFDRSWYNRGVVEPVMGFCTPEEYQEFLKACPAFERLLVGDGIQLIKYWLSISDEEQERRFQDRAKDPAKRWKISPVDLGARSKWEEFSRAKDTMFDATDIPEARWYQVEADDKRRARLNTIRHILSLVPYEDMTPPEIVLPPRPPANDTYERPPRENHLVVPDYYADPK